MDTKKCNHNFTHVIIESFKWATVYTGGFVGEENVSKPVCNKQQEIIIYCKKCGERKDEKYLKIQQKEALTHVRKRKNKSRTLR